MQMWILERSFENARRNIEKDGKGLAYLFRDEIYTDYFKLSKAKFGTWPRSKVAAVSRSLRDLEEKGFITVPGDIRPKGSLIFLSDRFVKLFNEEAGRRGLNVDQRD